MSQYPIRVALVGGGAIVERFYAPILSSPEFRTLAEVVAVFDPAPGRAEALLADFPRAKALADLDALIAERPELAIVASPCAYHARQSIALLAGGIGVLCEKPMARNSQEAEAMIAAAGKGPGAPMLAIGLFRRFIPAFQWVKTAIDRNAFGSVRRIVMREGSRFKWPAASDSFFRKEISGGGVLLDGGVHVIDTLIWWMGEPTSVESRDDGEGGVEGNALVICRFPGGAEAEVRLSWDSQVRNGYMVEFEHAVVEILPGVADSLRLRLKGVGTPLRLDGRLLAPCADYAFSPALPAADARQVFAVQVRDVLEATRGLHPPRVDGTEGIRSLRVIDRCYAERKPICEPWREQGEHRGLGSRVAREGRTLRIAVIGASGFVGTRLLEHLSASVAYDVRPIIPSHRSLARIARFAFDHKIVDVENTAELAAALAGCDLAIDVTQGDGAKLAAMAGSVFRACATAGVRRLVYMSSASVHGMAPSPGTDESTPLSKEGLRPYNIGKIEAELALKSLASTGGTELVILRPCIIWGPRSRWVEAVVHSLFAQEAYWVEGGRGIANLIHVDNLIGATLAACTAPGAAGETLLVNDPETVTWREFYIALGAALGFSEESFRDLPAPREQEGLGERIEKLRSNRKVITAGAAIPLPIRRVINAVLDSSKTVAANAPAPYLPPASLAPPYARAETADLHRCRWRFPSARADRVLGDWHSISFQDAVRRSADWARLLGWERESGGQPD